GQVTIDDDFWKRWRDLIGETTLVHQFEEMRAEGQMDAMLLDRRMHRGRELADPWADAGYWGGSIFWDSDLAKWLEAASARLEQTRDAGLEARVEEVIGLIERAQQPDGYVNSHILTWRPQHRFKNLRDLHELYCAGHLIEAAVVHFEATGKDRLLRVAQRYADYIAARFGREPGQIRGYCGHPEIELALLRLYHVTKERRYLDLSRYFIDERGQSPNFFEQEAVARSDSRPFRPNHPGSPYAYMQAHEPIRKQTKVVGHAVRAMYLFAAAAGLALEDGDADLLAACERLWQDVITTKLYITGGIGSASENEGFTHDYDLPNENSYAETCASIGLFLFGHRMLQAKLDGQYGDVMERTLYNNILSGISLEGRRFFYDNPMASSGSRHRVSWPWWTPCCPPNLARLVSSLSGYLYSQREDAIAVHHYVTGEARANGLTLRVRSGLPYQGNNVVEVQAEAPVDKALSFRIPNWAGHHEVKVNGEPLAPPVDTGYVTVRRTWAPEDRIELNFELPVRMQFSRYEVDVNRGRLALTRGPLVYCLEQIDNGPELDAVTLSSDGSFEPAEHPGMPPGILALKGPGLREHAQTDGLYADKPPATQEIKVTAVPYYVWNNRGPGEMLVWVRRAS
ncbi:MAG TPA: beta-L-arabinofuranosidase domain-containing protein, partial [Nitrospira sp.]|nr:beta-L-arabinofuranosidase domain-containing protein [Nitrospira sp.]